MMDQPIHWHKHLCLQLCAVTREVQKRHGELNALREIWESAKDLPADQLLTLILIKAMQVMTVRNGSVFVVDPGEPAALSLLPPSRRWSLPEKMTAKSRTAMCL